MKQFINLIVAIGTLATCTASADILLYLEQVETPVKISISKTAIAFNGSLVLRDESGRAYCDISSNLVSQTFKYSAASGQTMFELLKKSSETGQTARVRCQRSAPAGSTEASSFSLTVQ